MNKGNHRARHMHGGSEPRTHEAPFMRKPAAERHKATEKPLVGDRDPTGHPYYVLTGGATLPCYVRPGKKGNPT